MCGIRKSGLSCPGDQKLLQGFKVKIIIAYRHFFEWYPSFYYQEHIGSTYRKKWPGEKGGEEMPKLVEYIQSHLDSWEASGRNNRLKHRDTTHMSVWLYLHWKEVFGEVDVQLMDLHYPGDVMKNFVCYTLPNADKTCQYLKAKNGVATGDEQSQVQRVSKHHYGERVVDEALRQGLIIDKSNVTKKHFSQRVNNQLQKLGLLNDAENLWCADAILEDRLRNASLTFLELLHSTPANEQLYHHQDWTLALREHDELFTKAKNKNKFCEVTSSSG